MFFNFKHNYYLVRQLNFENDVYKDEIYKLFRTIPKNNKLTEYIYIENYLLTNKEAKKFRNKLSYKIDNYRSSSFN